MEICAHCCPAVRSHGFTVRVGVLLSVFRGFSIVRVELRWKPIRCTSKSSSLGEIGKASNCRLRGRGLKALSVTDTILVAVGFHIRTVKEVCRPSVAVTMIFMTTVAGFVAMLPYRGYQIHFLRAAAPVIRCAISSPSFMFYFPLPFTPIVLL